MCIRDSRVKVMGTDAFRDLKLNLTRAFLDTQWGMRTVAFAGYGCPLQADIRVGGMMRKLQDAHPERRDELVKILGVDPEWRMHRVSDGQRRRVQLLLGLVRPFAPVRWLLLWVPGARFCARGGPSCVRWCPSCLSWVPKA